MVGDGERRKLWQVRWDGPFQSREDADAATLLRPSPLLAGGRLRRNPAQARPVRTRAGTSLR